MKDNEYKCADCGGVFEKGWDDSEAMKEKDDNGWGDMSMDCMAVVCDDCYKKIMGNIN